MMDTDLRCGEMFAGAFEYMYKVDGNAKEDFRETLARNANGNERES